MLDVRVRVEGCVQPESGESVSDVGSQRRRSAHSGEDNSACPDKLVDYHLGFDGTDRRTGTDERRAAAVQHFPQNILCRIIDLHLLRQVSGIRCNLTGDTEFEILIPAQAQPLTESDHRTHGRFRRGSQIAHRNLHDPSGIRQDETTHALLRRRESRRSHPDLFEHRRLRYPQLITHSCVRHAQKSRRPSLIVGAAQVNDGTTIHTQSIHGT